MTGLLKDLMHDRADALEAPVLDLESITRDGDRRVRRHRGAAGALGTAAVVALIAAAPQLGDLRPDADRGDVAVSGARPLTWAEGSTIHTGQETVDVGRQVRAFVETGEGYVFTDPDGGVWSWAGSSPERVGQIATGGKDTELSGRDLASDGRVVIWLEALSPRVSFGWFDRATATTGSYSGSAPTAAGRQPEVLSVAAGTAYVFDGESTVGLDLTSPEAPPTLNVPGYLEIHDVVGGRYLVSHLDAEQQAHTTITSDPAMPGRELGVRGGDLSPTGRYVMSENSARESDRFTLLEVESGTELTPAATQDYDFFLGYAWIDDDSYTAFGMRGLGEGTREDNDVEIDLLVCEVAERSCTTAELGPTEFGFQIPGGWTIGE